MEDNKENMSYNLRIMFDIKVTDNKYESDFQSIILRLDELRHNSPKYFKYNYQYEAYNNTIEEIKTLLEVMKIKKIREIGE